MAQLACAQLAEALLQFDEELSTGERTALRAHLLCCPVCSLERAKVECVRNVLRTLAAPTFPAGMPTRIRLQVEA